MPTRECHPGPAAAVRVSRGVWLPAGAAAERLARLAALLAALPAATVLSGPTAAELHGLWVSPVRGVDVTVPASTASPAYTTGPRRAAVATHRRALSPEETTVVAGLPTTTLARTWYDLAVALSLADLVAAGDSALRTGEVTADALASGLDGRARRRGTALARRALRLLDGRSRSRPETHARVALVGSGLPAPDVNLAVHDEHGQWLAEPDLSYREARIAVEYQGADHADVGRMRRDVARHMDLRRAGWDVLYYTSDQVFGRPEVLVEDVRAALRRRAPQLLAAAAHRSGRPRVRSSTSE